MKATDSALNAYQTGRTLDNLRKAEYGLYGLTSANGLGEYATGRDMFGNELSEEQRERSLNEAFALLGGNAVSVGLRKASPTVNLGQVNKDARKNKNNNSPDVEVSIPSDRYPETSKHIQEAQKAGHREVLTIDRKGARIRRKDSLAGYDKVPGKDLDEYPPAMFKEGGKGASVRPISPSDNRGSGAYLGNKLRKYPDGSRVRLK